MKAAALLLVMASPALPCDVALSLIIDVSASISASDFAVQTVGMADALLDPTVHDALITGQVALNVVQWSGGPEQIVAVPWTQITGEADLLAFAARVRVMPREWQISNTAIGSAMAFAAETFADAPFCARRVIDVSGDGPANSGRRTMLVRDDLVARGFVINGIAIEGAIVSVTEFYRTEVIGGQGSFVITADGFADYPRAIRRKLIAEVTRPGS